MPTQNPRFRPPGWKERKPWQPNARSQAIRKRGRAGQRERRAVLEAEPFCRICAAKGVETAAEVVDHIVPLARGGSDHPSNKQPLCRPCHDAKSEAERAEERARRD